MRRTNASSKPARVRRPRPPKDYPAAFPFPCTDPLVEQYVTGEDFAGPVVGCATRPAGKRGAFVYVGGKAVPRRQVTAAMKASARTRDRLTARWSAPDHEPVPRAPRRPHTPRAVDATAASAGVVMTAPQRAKLDDIAKRMLGFMGVTIQSVRLHPPSGSVLVVYQEQDRPHPKRLWIDTTGGVVMLNTLVPDQTDLVETSWVAPPVQITVTPEQRAGVEERLHVAALDHATVVAIERRPSGGNIRVLYRPKGARNLRGEIIRFTGSRVDPPPSRPVVGEGDWRPFDLESNRSNPRRRR